MKERLAMLMSEANGNGNPGFSTLRSKNTKKAMVSLMATPDDAAVAEIMFDQMTEEDREKVSCSPLVLSLLPIACHS